MKDGTRKKTIRCVMKLPGKERELGQIENTLEALQAYVGGHIETVTIAEDAVVICNEEGRIKGMETNCMICGMRFYGPILVVGRRGDAFCSLSKRVAEFLMWRL